MEPFFIVVLKRCGVFPQVYGTVLANMSAAATFAAFLGSVLVDFSGWGDNGFCAYHGVRHR